MELTHAEIKQLKDKKFRQSQALFLLEGEKFCADAVRAGIEIKKTITTNKNLKGFPKTCVVSEKDFKSLSATVTPQSVICVCKIKQPPPVLVGDSLVLDRVQDPGNVGTLIRSALAFNFKNIICLDSADPYSDKVIRSSAGAILKMNIYKTTPTEFINNKANYAEEILVADMFGKNLSDLCRKKTRVAVVVGNEGGGVSNELKQLATSVVSIPMSGEVESLNAGVAGSIIMQRIFEKRGK